MKRPTADAASSLSKSLHPVNLMLYLSELGYPFEEVWPDIEEDWIAAVRAKDWNKFGQSQQVQAGTVEILAQSEESPYLGVSDDAGFIVEKLKRKKKWGDMTVTEEAMQKMTHLDPRKLDMAIQELLRTGLLIQDVRTRTYSLDSGRQYEIDRIAEMMIERSSHHLPY
jgi:hypothetical protein